MTSVCVPSKRPTYSPWGGIQTCHKYADGIYSVSTSSHGGFLVDAEAAATFSESGRALGAPYSGWLAYEEDCDWAIVAWERRDLWPQMFEYQRERKSLGADVCQGIYGEGCERPLFGELDGFGYCGAHESSVRTDRQMATDPEAYLRHTLSAWRAEYLMLRGDEPEPEGLAYWNRRKEEDKLRREKSPDYVKSAVGVGDGVVKVWTADDKVHYVTAESYGGGGEKARHRLSNMVLVDYKEVA